MKNGKKINTRWCPREPRGRGRAPNPSGHPVRRLMLFFRRKKANFRKKIVAKVSIQSELLISGNIRNGERAESGNAETERDRETDPISEGLSPLPRHGDHGPEGKPFSHLGRRSRKKKKGGSLPLSPGGAGTPPGPSSCDGDLHQHLCHLHQHLHHLPHLSTAVYSPTTRCTLYLNMVLYASYYYPMMCCHPMMSE